MKPSQCAKHLLMVRPVNFAFNAETAVNNTFQVNNSENHSKSQQRALQEFDNFVRVLRSNKINVTVVNDTEEPYTPDSIFPNNIISYHSEGQICLFPVFAENRRAERKPSVLDAVRERFTIIKTIDLTYFEQKRKFLEGTGSMVLDHVLQNVFACLSPRTDVEVIDEFCKRIGYNGKQIIFQAADSNGSEIYHTNVMMCVADNFAVVCLESIPQNEQRNDLVRVLTETNHEIIEITMDQMSNFAGNMLQVMNSDGDKFLLMSTRAYESLEDWQIKKLESFNRIIHSKLNTIEDNGGGSARCMLAEIFLPLK